MDKKRSVFLCKLPLANYIILGLMCAAIIPFVVLGILRVAEVGDFYSVNPAFDIAALAAEALLTAFILALTLLTRYLVTDKYFVFQRIIPTKIPVENLLLLRHELSENLLVLYFADDKAPDGVRPLILRVFPKRMPQIVEAIQKVNPHVSYETFDMTRKEIDE